MVDDATPTPPDSQPAAPAAGPSHAGGTPDNPVTSSNPRVTPVAESPDTAPQTLDLTQDPRADAAPTAPSTKPYDVSALLRDQESARATIAYILLAILGFIVVTSVAFLWFRPDKSKELHDLLEVIFAPLIALVGAATGYYFGAASKEQNASGRS